MFNGLRYEKRVKLLLVGMRFGSRFLWDVFMLDLLECIKFVWLDRVYVFELK